MKKIMIMALLLAFSAPGFASDDCDGDCPMKKMGKHDRSAWAEQNPEMNGKMQAMKKERKARKEAFKQNEEKIEKLVKQYKKLKPGKKQDAKKAEIAAVVAGFRDEQLQFKKEQLKQFQERLARMQQGLEEQCSPESKAKWLNKTVEQVIAEDGDLDCVLEHDRVMPRAGHWKMMSGPMGGMMGPGPAMMPGAGPEKTPIPQDGTEKAGM